MSSSEHKPIIDPADASDVMDKWISSTLRAGVIISAVLLIAGLIITFARQPEYISSKTAVATLRKPSLGTVPNHIDDVVSLTVNGRGRGIIMLGLLVLIATPVIRVALSIVVFWLERDHIFVWITSAVLAFLLLALWLGRAG